MRICDFSVLLPEGIFIYCNALTTWNIYNRRMYISLSVWIWKVLGIKWENIKRRDTNKARGK